LYNEYHTAPSTLFPFTYRTLLVSNLDSRVSDALLKETFQKVTQQPVLSCRVVNENGPYGILSTGYVEFSDNQSAEKAMQLLNGRKIFDSELKITWAMQSNVPREDVGATGFQLFIGDLSPEVNDQVLATAFQKYGLLTEARVMWDSNTGKSRGYGFVSFKDKGDAERALNSTNGEWLGSRPIRVNWANQKVASSPGGSVPATPISFEEALVQTPLHNTTVYIGNLPFYTTQEQLAPYFQQFGFIMEIRMQSDRGFAFVKMDNHENAAKAIAMLQGTNINGRIVRCSWGKDRPIDVPQPMWPSLGMSPTSPQASFSFAPSYSQMSPFATSPFPAPAQLEYSVESFDPSAFQNLYMQPFGYIPSYPNIGQQPLNPNLMLHGQDNRQHPQ